MANAYLLNEPNKSSQTDDDKTHEKVIRELLDDLIDKTELSCKQKLENETQESRSKSTALVDEVGPSSSTATAETSNPHAVYESEATCFYSLKWIKFNGTQCPILMQNENGPCPLISICNCLLLRGDMKIEPNGLELIENDKLIQMLANLLLNEFVPRFMARHQRKGDDVEFNLEQNISDALSKFESLQYGLNVNVIFDTCSSFEYTSEMDIFDLFALRLYHCWLIDPEQTEFFRYLAGKNYNQLVELTIGQINPSNEEKSYVKILAESFLESTASQITYYGLSVLQATLRPDELAILFRNNHFSTVYKCSLDNTLYTLVTDNGYLSHKNIVWETLETIDGDGRFCDAYFKDVTKGSNDDADLGGQSDQKALCQNDYLLALSLQDDLNMEGNEVPTCSNVATAALKDTKDLPKQRSFSSSETSQPKKSNKNAKKEKQNEKERDKCLIM